MSWPYGSWVLIDLPEPVIGFVYLDLDAGPSAKGGRPDDDDLAARPSLTVRLSANLRLTPLGPDEISRRGLPAAPEWLAFYGPQPSLSSPWHRDPLLKGFHDQFPDDLPALVHDGEPRRTGRAPEQCWVRIVGVEPGPARPVNDDVAPNPHVYLATLLNAPHALTSVHQGDRLKLLSVPGLPHPLHVCDEYLAERPDWRITPCDRCGASECFDPPSVMARVRFPNTPPDSSVQIFTSFCVACGGVQQLARIDE